MANKDKLIKKLYLKIKNLEIEREMFNDIMSHIPGHVYWLNTDNIYMGCNTEHAIHVGLQSRKDIVGKTNLDMPWKDIASEVDDTNNNVMRSGKPYIIKESSIIMGKPTVYLSNKVALRNKNNKIIGLLGISIDITKQEKLQKQLKFAKSKAESASIAKTEFIANMSHDIRTPLSGVVGLGGIVEKEIQDPKIKAKVHDMVKSADELLNMLNEILDVVSLDNISVKDIESEPFDLKHLVKTIIDLEKSSVDLKNIQLLQTIDSNIPSILIGDHNKIHHVLLNLVSNSIKFTQNGHVSVDIKLHREFVNEVELLFTVADTGIGIHKDSLDKIFELFYKETPSYKGLSKGHGVGLHIAKTYTELLGSKIHVESELEKGSKFFFYLRLKVGKANAKPQNIIYKTSIDSSEEPPLLKSFADKINAPEILIIEDNNTARIIAQTLINQAKLNPVAVEDGETGLELAKTKDFALILTDIGLPGISGIEFTKELRGFEKKYHKNRTPVIAVTAHAEDKFHTECTKAGIDNVIRKPLSIEIINEIFNKFSNNAKKSNINNAELDLPETEVELFAIQNEMIFDIESAKKILGDNNLKLIMELVKDTINNVIPEELPLLQTAYDAGDWQKVADISHKLKGGFLSISLSRAATACKYLERYHKTGKTELLEKLYQQMLETIEITSSYLMKFIK